MKKEKTIVILSSTGRRSRRIRHRIGASFLALLLLLVTMYGTRAAIHRYEPAVFGETDFSADMTFDLSLYERKLILPAERDTLRLMQLADPQLKFGFMTQDRETMASFAAALDAENPDLVICTGDLTCSVFTYDAYLYFADFMEARGQYWTLTFGNHDAEYDCSKFTLTKLLSRYPHCLFSAGPANLTGTGNFLLNVYRGEEATVPSYSLILLDSNMYGRAVTADGQEHRVYGWFGTDQIAFYTWAVEGLQTLNPDIASAAFFHIPVKEYASMYYAEELALGHAIPDAIDPSALLPVRDVTGQVAEFPRKPSQILDPGYDIGIAYQGKNTGFYDTVRALGSTEAMFCGHCHLDDLKGFYGDIRLCFGLSSGYHTYPYFKTENFFTRLFGLADRPTWNMSLWIAPDGTPMDKGVTLIEISLDGEDYGITDVHDRLYSSYR